MKEFTNGKYVVGYQENYSDDEMSKLPRIAHQKNAEIFLCGSKRFMDEIVKQLREEDNHKLQIHRTFLIRR